MTTMQDQQGAVSVQDVMIAVSRLQASLDALVAVGARAATESGVPADGDSNIDAVIATAGPPGARELPPPQRAMAAAFVRSPFSQAPIVLAEPTREPGWSHTDPAALEGIGRASMM